MPGMSGHEVARRIRLEAWGKHAVLIALTGWGQDSDKQQAIAAGFDEHMTKPVDPGDVEELLGALLRKRSGAPGAPPGESARNA
jgi:CheY-like chemotaxis protein